MVDIAKSRLPDLSFHTLSVIRQKCGQTLWLGLVDKDR